MENTTNRKRTELKEEIGVGIRKYLIYSTLLQVALVGMGISLYFLLTISGNMYYGLLSVSMIIGFATWCMTLKVALWIQNYATEIAFAFILVIFLPFIAPSIAGFMLLRKYKRDKFVYYSSDLQETTFDKERERIEKEEKW